MEGTPDWFLRALLTGKASFGMWCDVTADWALGLGFICAVAIPQFICFPLGITALSRGLEKSEMKAHFIGKTCLSQTLAVLTRLPVHVNLKELFFPLAIKPQDF